MPRPPGAPGGGPPRPRPSRETASLYGAYEAALAPDEGPPDGGRPHRDQPPVPPVPPPYRPPGTPPEAGDPPRTWTTERAGNAGWAPVAPADQRPGQEPGGHAWHDRSWQDTIVSVETQQPWPGETRRPRSRRAVGAGVVALALVAGLVGGYAGGRLGRGDNAPASVVRPVVQEVVASGRSSADQVQAVAAGLLPVTVQINAGDGARGGTGSGVIMRPDGFILTNNHVIDDADIITVVLPSSEAIEASLVGADPANDLAVIKVDRNDLPVANFGSSADLKVGELAVAVGSPFGLQGSVTAGVVSALHRVVEVGDDERLVNAIQTDASINPGNSGGALANGRGQVVGINTAIATGGAGEGNAGVGFAIPIDEAIEVAEDLIAGRAVRTPLFGVEGGIDLTPEVAERYGVQGRTGALVTRVEPSGAAERGGLRAGDLVVRIGEEEITGWDQLVVAVRKAEIGQAVPVVVVRQGEELTLQITPTERP